MKQVTGSPGVACVLSHQAVWHLKCQALTQEQYLDDTEMEDQVRLWKLSVH